jgi:hypothetical protein
MTRSHRNSSEVSPAEEAGSIRMSWRARDVEKDSLICLQFRTLSLCFQCQAYRSGNLTMVLSEPVFSTVS